MSIKLTPAEKIEDVMKTKGGTVTGDAKKMGISQCTMSDFINDKRNIKIDTLKKMCEYYKISADYVLGLSETKTTDKGVKAICASSNLSEKAAVNLSKLNAPCAILFINTLLENEPELIEKVGKKLFTFQYAKNVIVPNLKKHPKGKGIKLSATLNGEKMPEIPLEDAEDYARFELTRMILRLFE